MYKMELRVEANLWSYCEDQLDSNMYMYILFAIHMNYG